MIEYAKVVLPGVSSWKILFKKELEKIIVWTEPDEWEELKKWCYKHFNDLHPDVLSSVLIQPETKLAG